MTNCCLPSMFVYWKQFIVNYFFISHKSFELHRKIVQKHNGIKQKQGWNAKRASGWFCILICFPYKSQIFQIFCLLNVMNIGNSVLYSILWKLRKKLRKSITTCQNLLNVSFCKFMHKNAQEFTSFISKANKFIVIFP